MRRRISRHDPRAGISPLPILGLLCLAGFLSSPPHADGQDITDIISRNLRDLKSRVEEALDGTGKTVIEVRGTDE